MATADNVPVLLARLRGRSKVQQAAAARALSELASTIPGCQAIAAAGGAAALAEAVRSSGSAAVQQHAATAIWRLVLIGGEQQAAAITAPVVATGVVPTLLQLMRQPGALGEEAARALFALTALCLQVSLETQTRCSLLPLQLLAVSRPWSPCYRLARSPRGVLQHLRWAVLSPV